MFQDRNGVWYISGYTDTYTLKVLRSTNRGRSWSLVHSLASTSNVIRPEEPSILQVRGDSLICFIRSDEATDMWAIRSADGITWSSPSKIFKGGNHPHAIVTTGDSVIVITPSRMTLEQDPDGTWSYLDDGTSPGESGKPEHDFTVMYASWDNGYTWYQYLLDEYRAYNFNYTQEGADLVELSPGYIRLFATEGLFHWAIVGSDLSYWDFVVGSEPGDLRFIKR